jgi:hypothetical protein
MGTGLSFLRRVGNLDAGVPAAVPAEGTNDAYQGYTLVGPAGGVEVEIDSQVVVAASLGVIVAWFGGGATHSAQGGFFRIYVDGVKEAEGAGIVSLTVNTPKYGYGGASVSKPVAVGSHTVSFRWKSDGGYLTNRYYGSVFVGLI